MAGPTTKLVITRGLPASGKTTWARAWVAGVPGRRARVNRDDLRAQLFGGERKTRLSHADEESVTAAQQAAVRALLGRGLDVVVDDTNLRLKFARVWADLAAAAGAGFEVVDDFLAVPVDVCVERDRQRPDGVGEAVIRDMYQRFLAGGRLGAVVPTERAAPPVRPYVPPAEPLPPAWLVDIDGTLAVMGARSPYDWHRVGEDTPNVAVVELARALGKEATLILMSGRDEASREATIDWLERHDIAYDHLFMRRAGDMRKDSIVKAELFDAHVRGVFDVRGVVDDRQQVVDMWRSMGLTVAQVAPGDF